jgi:glucosamine--fructose-6-phosphate aminotransferase (isomerizing)
MSGKIIQSEIAEIPEVFQRILDNQKIFDDAISLIKAREINSVILVARGTSAHAALFIKTLIESEMGLPVGLAFPSAISINNATLNYRNTLVIGLSQSGQSPDLLSYLEAATKSGALVITMTNDANSPMAKIADLHIDILAKPEKALAATKSYSAQLLAGLILVRSWSGAVKDFGAAEKYVSELINGNLITEELLNKLKSRANLVFVGRGLGLANTREAALKVQETSYRFVQGFSAADFVHGPMAAVDKNCNVIVVAPGGISERALEKAVTEARTRAGEVIWLGSGAFAATGELSVSGCRSADQALNCVVDATLIQLLTVKFAISLGNDPDTSRGLAKVTLTF